MDLYGTGGEYPALPSVEYAAGREMTAFPTETLIAATVWRVQEHESGPGWLVTVWTDEQPPAESDRIWIAGGRE